jgi:DNA-binding phage protein
MVLTDKVEGSRAANVSHVAADAMNRLARAAERVERLAPQLEEARAELHAAVRQAASEGVEIATIARLSGLSRQRVHQIIGRR